MKSSSAVFEMGTEITAKLIAFLQLIVENAPKIQSRNSCSHFEAITLVLIAQGTKRSEAEVTKQLCEQRASSLAKFVNNCEQVETAVLPAENEWRFLIASLTA
jgi:hypothetical protein